MKYNSGLETKVYLDKYNSIQVELAVPSRTVIIVSLDELSDIVNDAKNFSKSSSEKKYKISSRVLDPQKIEKDFSFCGAFSIDNVDECVVKYILSGRGCNFNTPNDITFDNIRSYITPNGGEVIYVEECK